MVRLILGSGSPRRRELLKQIGVEPDEIRAPDIDETPLKGEVPRAYCARIAREKVTAVAAAEDDIVLCADTTVAVGRRILGKAENEAEARGFLNLLSGRRHRVITSVAIKRGENKWARDVETAVRMKRLSAAEIDSYIASGDWRGKAGAYGIQGAAGAFIPWINGSFTSVVGLPLAETANLLIAAGYPLYGEPS
ncbi:septum formation protein [Poseidonocella pacifica]|uniref:dTTP/UTP pyrophosphatase n=1 Tax=Poseidonocella pacifica TaxID=871651 RepID=A0A1I0X8F1_9RHOB|nr:septum formation protein [Poseidonocella pacifica]